MKRRVFLQAGLVAMLATPAEAQFGGLKPPKIPGIKAPDFNGEQFINHTPPITTNLADVYEAVPGFDNYHPIDAASLTLVPRDPTGGYLIMPGLFEITAQSFCLHAGSNPPSLNGGNYGSGYLYAPLKGPKAGLFERILISSESHPELPQYEVQLLLWAILAEQKLSDCPKDIQNTARVLLDAKDQRSLNDGALGVVPAPVRDRVYGNLPPLVRQGLEAENNMRELLASKVNEVNAPADQLVETANAPGEKVSALYAQMEAIAMRNGPLPDAPDAEKVPSGRWSWHPDGFYIRILPSGYPQTTRQLYYPEAFTVTGDRLATPDGTALVVSGRSVALGRESLTLTRDVPLRDEAAALVALRNAALEAEGPGTPPRQISDFLARAAMSALARGKRTASVGASPYGGTCADTACGGFGGGGGGGAGMGAPGTQRLAQSRTPRTNPTLDRTRNATKAIQNFGSKVAKAPAIPLTLAGSLVNWQLNMTQAIDNALNGDSTPSVGLPGHCSAEFRDSAAADDGIIPLPRPKQPRVGNEPLVLTAARQVFGDSLVTMTEVGRARLLAEQRFVSSPTADNGLQLVALRRRWGLAEISVADAGDALLAIYYKSDGVDLTWQPEEWSAYCQRLKTTGFTPDEIGAAKTVGYTDAEISAQLAQSRKLSAQDYDAAGIATQLHLICGALRDTGVDYSYLPAVSRSLATIL